MEYKEGDVWTSSGKTWTIKNGIKQTTHTQTDRLRQTLMTPLCCPQCNKVMKGNLDEKMWNFHSKCFDCVITEETKMRINGTWAEYEQKLMSENANVVVKDYIAEMKDYIKSNSHNQLVTESGDIEEWSSQTTIKHKVQEQISFLENYIETHNETK